MIFGIKEKNDNFDPYNVFLAIATNIPVLRAVVGCHRGCVLPPAVVHVTSHTL